MCKESCSLVKELPEFRSKIDELKLTDDEFAKLSQDYYALEQQIIACEKNNERMCDTKLKELKIRCFTIKDRLYMRLKHGV
ncbi:YdcH family protein [Pseudoalteromonas luteoviolacea]|uniref:DUF465 domain-containing protein n=1 Tax=Pseudoalteromonas luteoviolacea S4054 TaxID=1129367 RepID=A0A0F6A4N8_9GAMM|nr:DUF465 domain-containing protein [Pseudoalteromonas luteoviolacea]AOT08975.1 hypothetical protein S4054249_14380 [Pseudoalteromonas luteoviolacea]AOT13887.1 hypothetical protein S40542_14350 [Pseudoalteromonas luteoviolacea]AOT18802.1 hypothetical protein S4054_14355 [Pseudoalteromonas luteoviolacea]KKE80821.1 hypothetical protein N479_03870 [Pseudoalteromonas luteoviolacea S4054]KZN71045.1 hypothetical protein N481_20265 [Pseudoalteromonas luteoviolacea S4047-1]